MSGRRSGSLESAEPGDRSAPVIHKPSERNVPAIPVREILAAAATHEERDYRAAVLAAIDKRVAEIGPHLAQPDDNRGRQFKPFAALKGFEELIRETERNARFQ